MITTSFHLSSLLMPGKIDLFDFKKDFDLRHWTIVSDDVMGGKSEGHFKIDMEGNGVYQGKVSLENNGGFSSLRFRFNPKNVEGYSQIGIRLKGDRKTYKFRVKSNKFHLESYTYSFETSGEWQLITIPLSEMMPVFRGQPLNMPNYPGEFMEEIAFLIGNKKAESFRLELDKISLE